MKNVTVKIFLSAMKALSENALKSSPNETGGVLAGIREITDEGVVFTVLGVLGISDYDEYNGSYIATPSSFSCVNRESWAHLSLKAVEKFGVSYIGDWHSHPQSNLNILSAVDISFIYEQYVLGQFNPFPPLHILVQWQKETGDIHIIANVMLNNDLIIVLHPELID